MEACQRRFEHDAKVSYHLNKEDSLAMILERSVDFIFSFDSLVHVGWKTIEAYLGQFATKLTENGIAFIHH